MVRTFERVLRDADVEDACCGVRNEARELGLPTAPEEWIKVHDDPFRPQPRLDRDNGNGLTATVGRVREDPAPSRSRLKAR